MPGLPLASSPADRSLLRRLQRSFLDELRTLWSGLPDKWAVGVVLVAWCALFHIMGNSTLGYFKTESLFGWLTTNWELSEINKTEDEFSQYLPWMVLAILIARRNELAALPKSPWAPAVFLFAGGVVLHLVGYLVQQARISYVGFLLGVYASMGAIWGRQWLVGIGFPFWLLIFCVPFTNYLDGVTFQLRLVSTALSTGFADFVLGLKLVRVGTQVFHPATAATSGFQFDVAPACSGIRSALIIFILTITYGFLNFRSWWRRLLLVALSPALAILGNVVRLVTVFQVAEVWGQKAGEKIETNFGFVTFLIALSCVFLVGKWIAEPADPDRDAPTETPGTPKEAVS
jgi:exosortase